jgi:uncharacterized protein (TIGR00369 family)
MNDMTLHPEWDALLSNFNQLLGMHILEWSQGAVTLAIEMTERHHNRSSVLHGGVLATMIDAAGGYAGCFCPHPGRTRRTVTLSLTTNFLSPGISGRIFARAKVRGGGTKIYVSSVECSDEAGKLLALGEGVFRYLRGSEKPEGVPVEEKG